MGEKTAAAESTPLLLNKGGDVHLEEKASWLSRITFSWLGQIVRDGYNRVYEPENLLLLRSMDSSHVVCAQLADAWHHQQQIQRGGLATSIRKAFGYNMYIAGICKLLGDLLGFVGPICLNYLVKYLENPDTALFYPKFYGYILASVLFLSTVLQSLLLHQVRGYNPVVILSR